MKKATIKMIPVAEVRVLNPRSRNRITFQAISTNIANVGLKKPITVHERDLENDGTRYDLVCGQGRLESMRELGEMMIPAIINESPLDERYLMSLVENLARRPPSPSDLLREVKRLEAEHHKPREIADRLGLDRSYLHGIIRLLRSGEEGLIRRVEAGRIPIETAVKIATGNDSEVQMALSEAYENGTLRGSKLLAVQRLIKQRKGEKDCEAAAPVTSSELVRAYEQHTQQQRVLVRRSAIITERLAVLTSSLRRLFEDENFVTLLQAEDLRTVPNFLVGLTTSGED